MHIINKGAAGLLVLLATTACSPPDNSKSEHAPSPAPATARKQSVVELKAIVAQDDFSITRDSENVDQARTDCIHRISSSRDYIMANIDCGQKETAHRVALLGTDYALQRRTQDSFTAAQRTLEAVIMTTLLKDASYRDKMSKLAFDQRRQVTDSSMLTLALADEESARQKQQIANSQVKATAAEPPAIVAADRSSPSADAVLPKPPANAFVPRTPVPPIYTPAYVAPASPSGTYVGPRGGVYHYSASGKKVYTHHR